MRILVVQNMYPPHHYGGYELHCQAAVDRWRRQGHDVLVLTSDLRVAGAPADDVGQAGVRRVLPIAFAGGVPVAPPLAQRAARERASLRTLRAVLAEFQPDVVSVWHMAALSLGLLDALVRSGLPLVYVVCDDWLVYSVDADPWMRMFARRPALGAAVRRLAGVPTTVPDLGCSGAFCFVSDSTRRRAEELSPWTFPDASVVPAGVDNDVFPAAARRDRPWSWRMLYVGRLDGRKGVETAIRALAFLPEEASLSIIGAGVPGYRDHLVAVAASLGVTERVTFTVLARRDLVGAYRDADVVVFPPVWQEPFGLIPLEAMACATPVVATGVGGSAEFLVDGVNCVLFAPGDAADLADAIRALAVDPDRRRRLTDAGSATAAYLTMDRTAAALEARHAARAAQPA